MNRLLAALALLCAVLFAAPAFADDDAAPSKPMTDELAKTLPPQMLKEYLESKDDVAVKLAKINNGQDHKVAILVPGFFFASLIVGVLGVLLFRLRKEKQLHETLRLMIEKGAQIPPELLHPPTKKGSDLKRGLLLTGLGVGLAIMLMAMQGFSGGQWTAAFIPLFMGAGYLITWRIEGNNSSPEVMDKLATRG